MISITEKVKQVLETDVIAVESMRRDILNLSSYAQTIHPKVELLCKKNIKTTTIVVVLARIAKKINQEYSLVPKVRIDDMTVKSPLSDITYEKNAQTSQKVSELTSLINNKNDFFTFTLGLDEITLICSTSLVSKVEEYMQIPPKAHFENLVALTVRFNEAYLHEPNIMYALMTAIAVRRINIIEVISTYTEMTFILHKEDLYKASQALEEFFIQ